MDNEGAARGVLNTINHNDHSKEKDTDKVNIHSTRKEHDRGDGRTMGTLRESALETAASGGMTPQAGTLPAINTLVMLHTLHDTLTAIRTIDGDPPRLVSREVAIRPAAP
jgi:hypothetical protein